MWVCRCGCVCCAGGCAWWCLCASVFERMSRVPTSRVEEFEKPFNMDVITFVFDPNFYNIFLVQVDCWAVGCILGELLNHAPLIPGKNEAAQVSAKVEMCC